MDASPSRGNPRTIVILACLAAALYLALTLGGDLRRHHSLLVAGHLLGTGLMLGAFHAVGDSRRAMRLALLAALGFRLILAAAPPTLSDDVFRYVWDGRVQLAGAHPYRYAPVDPALSALRDADWSRINHPELRTIYPPVAQVVFAALAATGSGTYGVKLAMALADAAVGLLLLRLLRRVGLPARCALLHAWNPLAVVESAGSGHLDALGALLLLAGWAALTTGGGARGAAAFAAAVHVKLLPVVLLPAALARAGLRRWPLWLACLVLPVVPYALWGPAVGAGLFAYAGRWEHAATIYAAIEAGYRLLDPSAALTSALDTARAALGGPESWWHAAYRLVWPRELARLTVAALALAWVAALRLRPPTARLAEPLAVLGGVLLLSPTLHPWYLLWVLPWAAARRSPFWLALAATMPLSYLAPAAPGPGLLLAIFGPPLIAAGLAPLLASRRA